MIRSKLSALSCSALAVLALALATSPADAGHRHRRAACRPRCVAPSSASVCRAVPAPQAVYATPAASQDPSAFVAWLNATRARSGLAPVGWDPALASDAAANSARGFGHSYMGRARRQNAGVGPLAGVQSMWLASPAHASALLDPTIRAVGLAQVGGVWTYSAN